jgi:hypothetical protein
MTSARTEQRARSERIVIAIMDDPELSATGVRKQILVFCSSRDVICLPESRLTKTAGIWMSHRLLPDTAT